MESPRLRLPRWAGHPAFGVVLLLVLAAVLIAHGEPQPSSRPSGTSVGVSGTTSAPSGTTPLLVIRGSRVQLRQAGHAARTVALPAHVVPRQLVPGRDTTVVLGTRGGRQYAYAVSSDLAVRGLGYADAVIPAVTGSAAVIVETKLTDPGRVASAATSTSAVPSRTATTSSGSGNDSSGAPALSDYVVRRFDSVGRPTGRLVDLPPGMRVATDTAVGLVVWQPVNRVFDDGQASESLSAAATLIRPDGTLRQLGPVHPLTADEQDLLVWDVVGHRFGLMPLNYVTATTTVTATPTVTSASPTARASAKSASPTPSVSPSTVAGVRWFEPTRGILVTGPAAFDADDTAFAVYAQVGLRRRLVVAELQNVGTDQVEVLALAAPRPSATSSPSGVVLPSVTASISRTPTATSSAPALQPDGYPIPAPLTPVWWHGQVLGVGLDSTVIGYLPGSRQSALLDLGLSDISALAPAP